jgi:phosphohistidine phosphatase
MSELYLIRHADAIEVGQNGIAEDAERPLSDQGREQAGRLGRALAARGITAPRIVASPLRRAVETAEIVRQQWPEPVPELSVCEFLAPGGKRRRLTKQLCDMGCPVLLVVGHEPGLSRYAAWLIGGRKVDLVLTKAGVVRIDFEATIEKRGGSLRWLLPHEWIAVCKEVTR